MSESTKNDAIYLQLCDDEDSEWCDTVTWCQDRIHESDVKYIRADLVESLRQQLAAAQAKIDELNSPVILSEWQKMEKQLAAAQAACKAKDEAILHMCNNVIAEDNYDGNLVQKALDIQPDDSALKAWLGEPVAFLNPHGGVLQTLTTGLEKSTFTIPLYRAWEPTSGAS